MQGPAVNTSWQYVSEQRPSNSFERLKFEYSLVNQEALLTTKNSALLTPIKTRAWRRAKRVCAAFRWRSLFDTYWNSG